MSNGMMSSASIMMMDSVSGSSSRSPPMAPAPAHQHQPSFHATTPSTTTTTPTATSEDNNNNNNSHHSLHHHHSTDSNDEELVLAKDLSFRGSQPHQAAVITSTPPAHLLPHAVVDYETTSTSTNATTVTIGSQSDNEKPTTFVKVCTFALLNDSIGTLLRLSALCLFLIFFIKNKSHFKCCTCKHSLIIITIQYSCFPTQNAAKLN